MAGTSARSEASSPRPGHDGERERGSHGRGCTPAFARCVDIPGMVSNRLTGVVPGLVPGIHVLHQSTNGNGVIWEGRGWPGRCPAMTERESAGATVAVALPRLQDASISREWFPIALPASCPGFHVLHRSTNENGVIWQGRGWPGRCPAMTEKESAGTTVAVALPPCKIDIPGKKAALEAPLWKQTLDPNYAASGAFSATGPESRPLASTSRSTNSITAIGALSP